MIRICTYGGHSLRLLRHAVHQADVLTALASTPLIVVDDSASSSKETRVRSLFACVEGHKVLWSNMLRNMYQIINFLCFFPWSHKAALPPLIARTEGRLLPARGHHASADGLYLLFRRKGVIR